MLLVRLSNIVEHCRFNNKELDNFVFNDKGLDMFVFNDNSDNGWQWFYDIRLTMILMI